MLASETGLPVSLLPHLVEEEGNLFVLLCLRGLDNSEDTLAPIARVYDEVPQPSTKLPCHKTTTAIMWSHECAKRGHEDEGETIQWIVAHRYGQTPEQKIDSVFFFPPIPHHLNEDDNSGSQTRSL